MNQDERSNEILYDLFKKRIEDLLLKNKGLLKDKTTLPKDVDTSYPEYKIKLIDLPN